MSHEKNNETVGSASLRLQQESCLATAEELQDAMQGGSSSDSFENQVRECVERGCRAFDGDFYVVVILKKERLMQNVMRQYFLPRQSCPTPEWDQVVYFFSKESCSLKFLWTVPDRGICQYLSSPGFIPDVHEMELYRCVCEFNDGTLLALCKKLNKEELQLTLIKK